MTGGTLALIFGYLSLYLAFRGVARGGFGWRVRFEIQSIVFWLVVAIIFLFVSTDPAVRRTCFGCDI